MRDEREPLFCFTSPTLIGAIADTVPIPGPFLTPGKGSTAGSAELGRQVGLRRALYHLGPPGLEWSWVRKSSAIRRCSATFCPSLSRSFTRIDVRWFDAKTSA